MLKVTKKLQRVLKEMARRDNDELVNVKDLQSMTLANLQLLCKKLKLDSKGTKAEIIIRVEQSQATVLAQTEGKKDDGWATAMKLYQPKLKLDERQLDWGISQLQLTPALWLLMLWREPVSRGEVYGTLGTEGTFIEALMRHWRQLLSCNEENIIKLRGLWITIYALVNAARVDGKMSPTAWFRDHWHLHVVRELQAEKMALEGQEIANMAAIPIESLGYDVGELAEKYATKRCRGAHDDSASDISVRRPRNQRAARRTSKKQPKGKCRRCGMMATPVNGQSAKDWFEKVHNKVCNK